MYVIIHENPSAAISLCDKEKRKLTGQTPSDLLPTEIPILKHLMHMTWKGSRNLCSETSRIKRGCMLCMSELCATTSSRHRFESSRNHVERFKDTHLDNQH